MLFVRSFVLLFVVVPILAVVRAAFDSTAAAETLTGEQSAEWLFELTTKTWWIASLVLVAAGVLYLSRVAIAYIRWSPPSVFVAYHHSLFDQIKTLADALNRKGMVRCEFVPLSTDPKHDGLLDDVYAHIDRADYVIGVPGPNSSFVDHELSAASWADRPVLLMLADGVEAMPNTTHSSCPILLMDKIATQAYEPLIFLFKNLSSHPASVALISGVRSETVQMILFLPFVPACLFGGLYGFYNDGISSLLALVGAWQVEAALRASFRAIMFELLALSAMVSALCGLVFCGWNWAQRLRTLRALRRSTRMPDCSYGDVYRLLMALDPALSDCIRSEPMRAHHQMTTGADASVALKLPE